MMAVHRQPLKNTGTSFRTFANPSRVRFCRIKQWLRDDDYFTQVILSLLYGIAFILKRDMTAVHLISIKSQSILICCMQIVGLVVEVRVLPPILAVLTSHNFCMWEQTNKSVYQDRRQAWGKFSRHSMIYFALKGTNDKGIGKTTVAEISKWLCNYIVVQVTNPRWYKNFHLKQVND